MVPTVRLGPIADGEVESVALLEKFAIACNLAQHIEQA
jgi:hypothetical protein